MLQLHEIKKGKEIHKDNFLSLINYVTAGVWNPINKQWIPWCRISQTWGHRSEDCLYLDKIVSTLDSLYCKFCKFVGHDEKDCIAFQLLQEKMVDTYLMKNEEQMQAEWAQDQYPPAQYQQSLYPQPQYQQN